MLQNYIGVVTLFPSFVEDTKISVILDMLLLYLESLEKWDSMLIKKNILSMFLSPMILPLILVLNGNLMLNMFQKNGKDKEKFYQYTVIDEASRERFIYPYKEQSSYSTVDFIKRAIIYFGYKPKIIQTDNGSEFTHTKNTNRIHPFDTLCNELNIEHKLIRPRTPRHNGKVERSHRNDQNRFYNYLKFYSYEDLKIQMKAYLKRSNNIPMQVLGWISPIEKRNKIKEAYANASLPN